MLNSVNDTDLFLSYSSQRRSAAEHFAKTLEAYGYNVWFDYKLIGGRDFAFQLDERLRAAKMTIVMWCPISVESRWVHEEADLAATLHRLLPVKMESCELKLGTRRLQYLDLSKWSGSPCDPALGALISAIAEQTGKQPSPDQDRMAKLEADWVRQGQRGFSDFPLLENEKRTESATFITMSPSTRSAATPEASVVQSLIQPGKLTFGTFPYPPLICGDDPEEMSGPWPTLAVRLAEELGLEPAFRFTSFSDILENAYMTVDLVTGVFDTERRRKYFDFTRPTNRIGLLGLCREDLGTISEEALHNGDLRVLVQEGEVGWEYALDEAPRAVARKRVVSVDAIHSVEVLSMLRTGRFDVALIDALSCVNFMRDPALSQGLKLAFETPLNMFNAGVALRRTSGLDRDKIDALVQKIRNEPSYLALEAESLRGFEASVKRTSLR